MATLDGHGLQASLMASQVTLHTHDGGGDVELETTHNFSELLLN